MANNVMTVQIDHGDFKAIFTCTSTDIAVNLLAERDQPLANYVVPRDAMPRMNLLLAGIDAWSKELFQSVLASRGVSIAPIQETTDTD